MNIIVDAFAAGLLAGARTRTSKIERMEKQILLLESSLEHFTGPKGPAYQSADTTQRIIFTMQTADDNAARIKVQEKDRLGVPVTGETLTATVDQPAKATALQDPADPLAFIVTRLPAADGDPAILTVTVTITDSTSGLSGTQAVEFDPGKAATMTFETELASLPGTGAANTPPAPAAPAVGSTVSIPAVPSDPASPAADHTVTAVSADGSTAAAEPVSGGPAVTVPTASAVPAAT